MSSRLRFLGADPEIETWSLSQLNDCNLGELFHEKCFELSRERLSLRKRHLVAAHSDCHRLDVTLHAIHSATSNCVHWNRDNQ